MPGIRQLQHGAHSAVLAQSGLRGGHLHQLGHRLAHSKHTMHQTRMHQQGCTTADRALTQLCWRSGNPRGPRGRAPLPACPPSCSAPGGARSRHPHSPTHAGRAAQGSRSGCTGSLCDTSLPPVLLGPRQCMGRMASGSSSACKISLYDKGLPRLALHLTVHGAPSTRETIPAATDVQAHAWTAAEQAHPGLEEQDLWRQQCCPATADARSVPACAH